MKVFISWSGENSRKLGEALRNWIPAMLQAVKPYFTPSDVEKGARWNSEIAKELESSEIGILCVTRDNLHSDWVIFEAGALSKSLDVSRVCPVLFGIQNTDLAGPLKQFQTTEFRKEDVKKLVSLMNSRIGEQKLGPSTLDTVFEKWWPELESGISKILAEVEGASSQPIRSERELLEEVLELSRMMSRRNRKTGISGDVIMRLFLPYVSLHNQNQAGQGGYQETLDLLREMQEPLLYLARYVEERTPDLENFFLKIRALTFRHVSDEIPNDDAPF